MLASWIGREWENITVKARQSTHTVTSVNATWTQRGFCVHEKKSIETPFISAECV